MLTGSCNIWVLGKRIKHNKMNELFTSKSMEFLVIQETKINDFSDSFVHALWVNSFCDQSFSPSSGNNVGPGYLGVCIEWGVAKSIFFIVNIYSKCIMR